MYDDDGSSLSFLCPGFQEGKCACICKRGRMGGEERLLGGGSLYPGSVIFIAAN